MLAAAIAGTGVRDPCRGERVGTLLAAALPLAQGAGVTRIADLTGLDRIGVPVVSAVRPNARSVTSASGKGLDFASSCLSSLMEALELHHAENARPDCCLADLPAGVLVPAFTALPRIRDAPPVELMEPSALALSSATEIVSASAAAVPFDLVHCVLAPSWHRMGAGFLVSTNGLAGGADRDEAILHGLCEVVERDALALLQARDPQHTMTRERRVDLARVEEAGCASLVECCRRAGVEIAAFDICSEIGVPVFYARVAEPGAPALRAVDGSGCHPDASMALRRAILEAIQTRALMISGARDEIRSHEYRVASIPLDGPPAAAGPGTGSCGSAADGLRFVLDRLTESGLREVLVVDLPSGARELAFVRVVVPGLEGPIHSALYAPGPRARTEAAR